MDISSAVSVARASVLRNMRAVVTFIAMLISPSAVAEFDWSLYQSLLDEHLSVEQRDTTRSTFFDYASAKGDERVQQQVDLLAALDSETLDQLGKEERIVFFSNAYNFFTIKLVLDHLPVESIKDIGTLFMPVWKKPVGRIAGRMFTLHDIEHGILRKTGEARIHFAIVCASLSCPNLHDRVFHADDYDAVFDRLTEEFLSDPRKGLKMDRGRLYISKVFQWFEEDFLPYGGVLAFIRQHYDVAERVERYRTIKYEWALNDRPLP